MSRLRPAVVMNANFFIIQSRPDIINTDPVYTRAHINPPRVTSARRLSPCAGKIWHAVPSPRSSPLPLLRVSCRVISIFNISLLADTFRSFYIKTPDIFLICISYDLYTGNIIILCHNFSEFDQLYRKNDKFVVNSRNKNWLALANFVKILSISF